MILMAIHLVLLTALREHIVSFYWLPLQCARLGALRTR